jgi:hypothetical protein
MSKDSSLVKPYNTNNAIKVVAFALEFNQSINMSKDFINSLKGLSNKDNELVIIEDIKSYSVKVEHQNAISHGERIIGVEFSYNNSWVVKFLEDKFLVYIDNYTRWEEIFATYLNDIYSIFSDIINGINIQGFTLEYIDEFTIVDLSQEWQKDIFDFDTDYISKHQLNNKSTWHLHQGFFSDIGLSVLNNININVGNIKESHNGIIIISTQHKVAHNSLKDINNIYNSLHDLNKEIISDILSTTMCNKISLKKKK